MVVQIENTHTLLRNFTIFCKYLLIHRNNDCSGTAYKIFYFILFLTLNIRLNLALEGVLSDVFCIVHWGVSGLPTSYSPHQADLGMISL